MQRFRFNFLIIKLDKGAIGHRRLRPSGKVQREQNVIRG